MKFSDGAPLGGAVPETPQRSTKSDPRDLILTSVLLVAALTTGASSLMPWRDYAWKYSGRATETGWIGSGGNLGRGWITVLCAVVIALAGVLIAAERTRPGRILAVLSGVALMVIAVSEWGLGDGGSRNGPGLGLWVELVVGAVVVLAVGIIEPSRVDT